MKSSKNPTTAKPAVTARVSATRLSEASSNMSDAAERAATNVSPPIVGVPFFDACCFTYESTDCPAPSFLKRGSTSAISAAESRKDTSIQSK